MLIAVIIVIPLILISKCTTKNKTESDNVQANVTSTASALNSSESQTEIADDDQETYLFLVNDYNVPLVKTQMKKIIVTAKTLYSHPKNVSKIYAALHTDLAW